MRNNFTFCSSIKIKKLEKMEDIINLLITEKTTNDDLQICQLFKNLLNSFDKDIKNITTNEVIEKFGDFYEKILVPYCRKEVFGIENFQYFDFEQTQYVFDKMGEIIDTLGDKYNIR